MEYEISRPYTHLHLLLHRRIMQKLLQQHKTKATYHDANKTMLSSDMIYILDHVTEELSYKMDLLNGYFYNKFMISVFEKI